MRDPHVLTVGFRRIKREGYESLLAMHRTGFRVAALGRALPEWAGPLVDQFRPVDPQDIEATIDAAVDLARRNRIVGIVSLTEADLLVTCHIAEKLALPSPPPEAALRARNKLSMKAALSDLATIQAPFERVGNIDQLERALTDIGLPAVLKPAGASGSKGIFVLADPSEAAWAMEQIERIMDPSVDPIFRQFPGEMLVERFVDGHEVSVDGFVVGGRVEVVAITDKTTTVPYCLELQHILPSRLPGPDIEQVERATRQVLDRLGFDHCAFHLEAKLSSEGFHFIEATARPAGGYIGSHLVPTATGIDLLGDLVRIAVGQPPLLRRDRSIHAGVRFVMAEMPGRFDRLDGLETLLDQPGFDFVFQEIARGTDVVLPPRHFGLQRVAAVGASHPAWDGVHERLGRVGAEIRARTSASRTR